MVEMAGVEPASKDEDSNVYNHSQFGFFDVSIKTNKSTDAYPA